MLHESHVDPIQRLTAEWKALDHHVRPMSHHDHRSTLQDNIPISSRQARASGNEERGSLTGTPSSLRLPFHWRGGGELASRPELGR
jgi:hypothetical protein